MVCAPVRSIIPSLKLGDYLSVQAHKPCSISHLVCSSIFAKTKNNLHTCHRVRLDISYTCTALRYKPAFIAMW